MNKNRLGNILIQKREYFNEIEAHLYIACVLVYVSKWISLLPSASRAESFTANVNSYKKCFSSVIRNKIKKKAFCTIYSYNY